MHFMLLKVKVRKKKREKNSRKAASRAPMELKIGMCKYVLHPVFPSTSTVQSKTVTVYCDLNILSLVTVHTVQNQHNPNYEFCTVPAVIKPCLNI